MPVNGTPAVVGLASTLHYVVGFGFSIGSLPFALYVLLNRRLPVFLGIRFFDGGFIERSGGIEAVMVSSLAYVLAMAVNILAGYWLAQSMRLGGILGLLLFPLNMFFALGFAAPVPIVLHPIMAVVILLAWSHLR